MNQPLPTPFLTFARRNILFALMAVIMEGVMILAAVPRFAKPRNWLDWQLDP